MDVCRSVSGNVLICELKVNVWLSLCGCVNVYLFMAEYELEKKHNAELWRTALGAKLSCPKFVWYKMGKN